MGVLTMDIQNLRAITSEPEN